LDVQSQTAWVTGWGAQYFGGPTTTRLMQVAMPILTDARCKQRYSQMYNTASQICAGEYSVGLGACQVKELNNVEIGLIEYLNEMIFFIKRVILVVHS
jgi:hypothetical protein